MSFLLRCPNCGDRDVYEFRFGGKVKPRPTPGAADEEWLRYSYSMDNESGPQKEWWYHRLGCRQWFFAVRDTKANQVQSTSLPDDSP